MPTTTPTEVGNTPSQVTGFSTSHMTTLFADTFSFGATDALARRLQHKHTHNRPAAMHRAPRPAPAAPRATGNDVPSFSSQPPPRRFPWRKRPPLSLPLPDRCESSLLLQPPLPVRDPASFAMGMFLLPTWSQLHLPLLSCVRSSLPLWGRCIKGCPPRVRVSLPFREALLSSCSLFHVALWPSKVSASKV